MKPGRRFLVWSAAVVVVVAGLFVVALSSAFQTWAARRYLANHPELPLSVGRVAAGFHHLELTDVAFANSRLRAQAPRIDASVDMVALLFHHEVDIANLVARGWTCEVARNAVVPATSGDAHASSAKVSADAKSAATHQSAELRSILASAHLPLPVTLEAVDADGTVKFGGGTARVHVTGGNFGAQRTGTLRYTIDAERSAASPTIVHVTGSGSAIMGSDREFTQLQLRFEATASGGKLDRPVTVQTQVEVTRTGNMERYGLAVAGKRPLINATAELAEGARALRGNWSIDLSDGDIAPFALGRPLPEFSATGAGQFDSDTTLTSSHLTGSIAVAIDRLGILSHAFDEVGAVKVQIDSDVAQRGRTISISRFQAAVSADNAPVGIVRALQAFEFDPRTRALRAADANAPLLGISVEGLPLRWVRPFVAGFSIEGDALHGELTATPRAGGLSFATRAPIAVSRLSVTRGQQALAREVDVSATVAGDYMPQGWQIECRELSVRRGGSSVAVVTAHAGRLAGADQPLKATGHATFDFAALRTQPIAASIAALQRGTASLDFSAAVGQSADWQSTFELKNLGLSAADDELPNVKGTVRVGIDAERKLTLNAPIQFERGGRVSDLTLAGTFNTGSPLRFDARVTSANLVLADLQPIRAVFPGTGEGEASAGLLSPAIAGAIALDLKHVSVGSAMELSNVTGTIRCGNGAMAFENIRGATLRGGEASVVAAVRREGTSELGLVADVAATELEAAPWFSAIDPHQPPTVDGRFTITSKLTARASTFAALAPAALGEVECTSKGGIFRGLAVNVGNLVENSSKLSAWLAAAGDAIKSPFIGRKDQDEITSRAQAANELARLLSSINYDQLAVVVMREESDVARIKEFTLISPELRIRGAGVARRDGRKPVSHQLVDLDLTLRARGRTAELMKYLGILETKTDDLGYATCTIPVRVEGALDRPDTTQLSNRLVALAVEKTGLTEKAVDWINRLRGKSAN